jgi:signal transduction histidine kinase/ligand-binding sensor domain-containing protein
MSNLFYSSFFLFNFILFQLGISQATNNKVYEFDNRIVLQNGLSQSRVKTILEDERGFMWFGTADGLNRYDGYKFRIFRKISNDTNSLPDNNINSMVEDLKGNIWIGTSNGLIKFNPYTEVFKSFKETNSLSVDKRSDFITSCAVDSLNNIWYSVKNKGIYKINTITHEKQHITLNTADSSYLRNVDKLYIDKNNTIWIGSYLSNGVLTYNINTSSFKKYTFKDINNEERNRLKTYSFFEDNNGRLWLSLIDYNGLDGSLYYLNKGEADFKNYKQFLSKDYINANSDRLNSIASIIGDNDEICFASMLGGIYKFEFGEIPTAYYTNSPSQDATIICLYKSKNGILWIGTNGNGIEISIPNNTEFKTISNKLDDKFTIESIRTFAEDEKYYWVGGYYGLAKINKDFSEINTIKPQSVYSIANSIINPKILWTGSEGGGLKSLNKKSYIFEKFALNSTIHNITDPNNIFDIYNVDDTLLLIGTINGLFGYNPISKSITLFPSYCNVKKTNVIKTVRTIYKDKANNILIGFTQGGIGKLDLNKGRIERFDLIPQLENDNNYNPVNCIYNDENNRYWIATNYGLLMVDIIKHEYRTFTENDGLPNSHIYGILPDEEGKLWLSTNNGLSHYSPNTNTFSNYDISDGLQNNEFNTGAYFKAKDGTLFFGGVSGFNYFNPKQITQNSIIPRLVITELRIQNKTIQLDKQETNRRELLIKSGLGSFTIEFAGLSFINSENNTYKYRLKELNSNWIDLGQHNKIRFNSIEPGEHTLEILASNNHGLWLNEPFSFTIIKEPTFFESALFKWLLAFVLIILVVIGIKMRVRRITKQKENLQVLITQKTTDLLISNETLKDEIINHENTSKALVASNLTKDKFLSIMAHDIINPLGVIQGFSDLLIDKSNNFSKEDIYSFLKTINTSTKGLTSLLSNLLQWSKLQNGTIIPNAMDTSVRNCITDTIAILQGNITEKEISLIISVDENITVFADMDMLLTVFRNLISNAIKFTPIRGTITINANQKEKTIEISIIDTGVGISNENLEKLFNKNQNISTKGTRNESGTGLGLGLVHEFVILNNGKLWIESKVGQGSKFYFSLPRANNITGK